MLSPSLLYAFTRTCMQQAGHHQSTAVRPCNPRDLAHTCRTRMIARTQIAANTQPPGRPNASLAENNARHCPCPPQVHGRASSPGPSGGLWVAASALVAVARALRALPSAPPLRRPSAACMQVEAISVHASPPQSDMPRRSGSGAAGHQGGAELVSYSRSRMISPGLPRKPGENSPRESSA